jgi:hypothetical protein
VSGTTVSYNAFTGSHYAWTAEPVARGLLVSFSGDNRTLHGRKGAEPVYGVARTERTNDPSVLGVYLGRLEPHQTDQPVTENPHLVAAVGNAELWVVDTGADVAPGDDLVASAVPGHAMKDAGEFERSHVVAKAAEPIRWKDVTETIAGRRHRRISVLLGAFTREGTRALASALAERETELLALRRRFDAVAAAVERLEALLLREAAGPPRATKLRTR